MTPLGHSGELQPDKNGHTQQERELNDRRGSETGELKSAVGAARTEVAWSVTGKNQSGWDDHEAPTVHRSAVSRCSTFGIWLHSPEKGRDRRLH
ncbi:uncharacterized protein LOC127584421 isoform X2 [Pristis pectinata]|uniref:uncharacterized protein LOC127584421 isoform X2 n=1 Tax=Pristis pectinata TaxID=685728 RepID=UPI00223DEAF9|nr:uncharacterized protein LOC127584421 isoform X2 [Pristis pectinata]